MTPLFWLSFSWLLGTLTDLAPPKENPPPNIIIIYADDLGYGDLGSYGGDIPTPNIDRIGQAGIHFTDFYVSAPVCTPSRYSLLTGSYPQRSLHGLDQVIMPGDEHHFDPREVTLAELLKQRQYRTAITGKWHLGSSDSTYLPTHQGFDVFSGHKAGCIDYFRHVYGGIGSFWYVDGKPAEEQGYSTELITNHAINVIEQQDAQRPFFLYVPYNAPHFGKTDPDTIPEVTVALSEGTHLGYGIMNSLQAPEAYVQRFSHVADPYRRVYSAMVASLDDQVGRLLDKLNQEGLAERTMIWFISDNGGYAETYQGHASNGVLRGEKASLWEGGIRVPAMVCWPGVIPPDQVITQPACNVDIVPTVGAIAGFTDTLATLPIDGIDLSPVLFRQQTVVRDIFWQYRGQSAFRRGEWKLRNGTELYHLATDVSESEDVADAHPERVKELRQALRHTAEQLSIPTDSL